MMISIAEPSVYEITRNRQDYHSSAAPGEKGTRDRLSDQHSVHGIREADPLAFEGAVFAEQALEGGELGADGLIE